MAATRPLLLGQPGLAVAVAFGGLALGWLALVALTWQRPDPH